MFIAEVHDTLFFFGGHSDIEPFRFGIFGERTPPFVVRTSIICCADINVKSFFEKICSDSGGRVAVAFFAGGVGEPAQF